jgi:hypothetical protein
VYAPGVAFQGPLFIGNINASGTATPVIMIGSGPDVRITGGDLAQPNGFAVQVSGLTQLKMTDGSTSQYVPSDPSTASQFIHAQAIKGHLVQNGQDVTAQVVVNPTP